MTDRFALPSWAAGALVLVATAGVVGVIAVLVDQNRTLKEAVTSQVAASGVVVGDALPDVDLVAADGRQWSLHAAAAKAPVVLAFMTTTCASCERNLPQWERLAGKVSPAAFLLVSLDPPTLTEAYWAQHELAWEALSVDIAWIRALRLAGVPTTLVVGRGGEVLFSKGGPLRDSDIRSAVEHMLGTAPPILP